MRAGGKTLAAGEICSPAEGWVEESVELHGIRLQRQPTPNSCMQTCLAMALGVPVADVIKVYGDKAMNCPMLKHALNECRILWNAYEHGLMILPAWHFVTVPSLNIQGGMHEVLIYFEFGTGEMVVFDPSSAKRYDMTGRDLLSWSEVIPFIPGGKLSQTTTYPR